MRKLPVILLAFANDEQAFLKQLSREENSLRHTLSHLHQQEVIELVTLGSATIEDIFRAFNLYHNRIIAFHFGGHSNHSLLNLTNGIFYSKNLANLIGLQDHLHLVILNGCANKAQVSFLLDKGARVTIATNASIGDHKATMFAEQFYQAMVGGKSIHHAFDSAINYLDNQNLLEAREVIRGIGIEEEVFLPWGLFYNEETDITWQLPQTIPSTPKIEESEFRQPVRLFHPHIHQKLIEQMAQGLTKYHKKVEAEWEEYLDREKDDESFIDLQNTCRDRYPSVVGVHLRALCTPECKKQGRLRLKTLYDVYYALSKYLCSIVLSDLWEQKIRNDGAIALDKELARGLFQIAGVHSSNTNDLDYLWVFFLVCQSLAQSEAEVYVPELKTLVG